MKIWKQVVGAAVILAGATTAWAFFHPSAPGILQKVGIDWAPVATANVAVNAATPRARNASGPLVIVRPVTSATINDRLSAIGTGRAKSTVAVTTFAAGRMDELLVESGGLVKAGDIIARLDSDTEIIAADRARLNLKDAEARLQRARNLRTSNTVSAVQVTDAELAVETARLALRDAELALSRRSIHAPIGGIVGILPVSAGNYVTTQTEIATIDDRSELLVDFWVPERFAPAMKIETPVTATSIARPGEVFHGVVSAVDNRVDSASRTLQVQARIINPNDTLRAGMAFQITAHFSGETYPAVDPLAIQWGTDGAFVWRIADGVAERVPVRIVQRNSEIVLVDASLAQGDQVVAEGIQSVRAGSQVQIKNEGGPAAPKPDGSAPTASIKNSSGG
ncbi:MAG: efflux RND transporter periplasmic adaptor subunit [Phyllobacterium sp.]